MSERYELTAEVKGRLIDERFIEVVTNLNDTVRQKSEELHRRIIDSEDKLIREGLIRLSWTPPVCSPTIHGD